MVSFPKWALGWGKEVVFTQKASRQWEAASDMDIMTFIAWPVDMLAFHHPPYRATKPPLA